MDIASIFRRSTLLSMAFITTLLVGCGGDGSGNRIIIVNVSDSPEVCDHGLDIPDIAFFCEPPLYNIETGNLEGYAAMVEGFSHEFGVASVLRVQAYPIEDQAADGPIYDFRLIETIRTTQVAQVGDIYTFDIPLNGYMFQFRDGQYAIQGYEFNCAEGVDCQQLLEIDGSEGLATIEFTYVGGEVPITLTSWN
ncbi:protein of unknown function [Pseudidiomarina planktonica]|uniref:DUF4377 domain-containing protein n=1 Tax=Pseudidiomarina planktonica TaxID=1323738 RepID=A0A1Y6ELK5_9GAMM|nr:DUF4377 domain-containing protein [Pseudidiomarina planktonica]RUO66019.1 DUF4377 domain-containing protein [Pseudidiomarina planktonica]SMQ61053.1 protein of unknown function [Pseudidiomarina planktonica]